MNQIKFERNINNVFVQTDAVGIWIHCGWSLPIPWDKAVEYVKKYDTDPNAGFFEHEGKVILSHNGGKITFSQQESNAVIELIKTVCPEL